MYARLSTGGTGITAFTAMRDIARLLTSSAPHIGLVQSFSAAASVIIDPTPAGWTFVGSNSPLDNGSINSGNDLTGLTADVQYNIALSAPCLDNPLWKKYAVMTLAYLGSPSSTATNSFALTAARSVSASGVCTNEGPRYWTASSGTAGWPHNQSLRTGSSDVFHVIANQRHITIVIEGRGFSAVWETSTTDVHRFYNEPPVVQLSHNVSSILTRDTIIAPTQRTSTAANAMLSAVIGAYNVANGSFSGTLEPTNSSTVNQDGNWLQMAAATSRVNTINEAGAPRYQINPVWLHIGWRGYPVQYVSGVVPIYWTKPQIGTTGDEMVIEGESYTFFNAGAGAGLVLKTS